MRGICAKLLILIILIPVYPLFAISTVALSIAQFMDWLVIERKWSRFILSQAEKVQKWGENSS
jgi:hypothetical protein